MGLTHKMLAYVLGIWLVLVIVNLVYLEQQYTDDTILLYADWTEDTSSSMGDKDSFQRPQPEGGYTLNADWSNNVDTGNKLWKAIAMTFNPAPIIGTSNMTLIETVIINAIRIYWGFTGLFVFLQFVIIMLKNRGTS